MYTITLDGPAKNALNMKMMRFITNALKEAAGQPVLITGAGDTFCAGLDLREVGGLDHDGMTAFLTLFQDMNRALFLYPGPTCALVNGHAIAGGAILALLCDLSVSAPNSKARLGLNEVALGLRFPPGLFKAICHQLPPHHRETVLLGAELHNPTEAARLGLLTAVVDNPRAWAEKHLKRRGASPRAAYTAVKLNLRESVMDIHPDEEKVFIDEVLPVWTSGPVKAMIAAFLSPRK